MRLIELEFGSARQEVKMFDAQALQSRRLVARSGLDEGTALKMKVSLVGFQCLGLLLAIAVMWLYPITRQRAEETQRKLRKTPNQIT